MVNSRMKDFYDVYFLSVGHNFKGDELKKAIETTFKRRETPMPDIPLIFKSEFQNDKEKQKMWIAFLRKSRLHDVNRDFNEVMQRITAFLKPIIHSIIGKSEIKKSWIAKSGVWG